MGRRSVRVRAVAVLAVAGLALAACGGGGEREESDASGRTLTIAAPGVLSSLDSERYQGYISIDLLPNTAGTLVRFVKPEAGATKLQTPDQLEAELAESWTLTDGGKKMSFTLRDAKSQFGNPITAEDVKWSVDRMVNSTGVPIAKILMGIGGWDVTNPITVVDDKTFTINVAQPNAVSLSILTTFFMTIYDSVEAKKHATADDPYAYKWLGENTATFGPYQVRSFDPGKEVRLTANENYFRGTPKVRDVVVRAVADTSNRLQLAQSGQVDVATAMTFDQLSSLQNSGDARLERVLYPNIDVLVPNLKAEPFDDKRVREAISYAVDRQAIVDSAYQGFSAPSTDFMHDDFGAPAASRPLAHDLDRAKQLLAEAGLPNGFPMELAYNAANVGAHSEQVAVLLRSQLAKVGIEVKLNNVASGADFDTAKREGKLQTWLATSTPLVPDPAYYLQVFYSTGGLTNLQNYSSPTLDGLSRQILETQPGPERDALVKQVNDFLVGDMPAIPLVDSQKYYVFKKGVDGFVSYSQGHVNYYDISVS
ncbi:MULTISPECIES: ABC transporter substrate-binding protein [Micromonospora]|uniref:Peptide/nickel transport system substrate-binding protein n=1 Tax=Micromonospora yangpuensis TaxID=683228 RepID=A0A1C6ULZ3_9ACTN|nr:ABC transporter substrate-binding protein [Micromonospora yangpuensis]GGM18044.1 ABC transporter substrate-binding protein [Micromonospora yangpuensis]SCL54962.1 peptide/nickel transport system substrate-binding protein [Micromonospora yangpuensis]